MENVFSQFGPLAFLSPDWGPQDLSDFFSQAMAAIPGGRGGRGGAGGGDTGGFQSGYRQPPSPGMSMTPPPANFWQGGNFNAPGVSGSPLMTSDVLSRFPQLAGIAGGGGPPPMPTPQQSAPTQAADPSLMQPGPPATGAGGKNKKNILDKLMSGGLLGLAPALGGKGAGLAGVGGLLPGLLFD